MSLNPWLRHLLKSVLKCSQASHKGSPGPCLNVEISNLDFIKRESGKNCLNIFLQCHSSCSSCGWGRIEVILLLWQLMRKRIILSKLIPYSFLQIPCSYQLINEYMGPYDPFM